MRLCIPIVVHLFYLSLANIFAQTDKYSFVRLFEMNNRREDKKARTHTNWSNIMAKCCCYCKNEKKCMVRVVLCCIFLQLVQSVKACGDVK